MAVINHNACITGPLGTNLGVCKAYIKRLRGSTSKKGWALGCADWHPAASSFSTLLRTLNFRRIPWKSHDKMPPSKGRSCKTALKTLRSLVDRRSRLLSPPKGDPYRVSPPSLLAMMSCPRRRAGEITRGNRLWYSKVQFFKT